MLTVEITIDEERLPAMQGALAFLADVCLTYGNDNSKQGKSYAAALGYVLLIASCIGEAVIEE